MNYRHAFHAGNFADVFKHVILTRLIEYLKLKDKAFRVFDTHSGIGTYDLTSAEAQKTDEWRLGVERALSAHAPDAVHKLLKPWKEAVAAAGENKYPGSPLIAHGLLRKIDRLSLYELHEEDAASLEKLFEGDFQTRVSQMDGWLVPVTHIPPKQSRGLVLVDPPFEDGHDFDRMIEFLKSTQQRWAGGVVALWYPIKKRDHTDDWLETLRMLKFPDLLNAELYIREPRASGMLNGCGMVILNPPYTLKSELNLILPCLAETLQQGKGWGMRVQDLSAR